MPKLLVSSSIRVAETIEEDRENFERDFEIYQEHLLEGRGTCRLTNRSAGPIYPPVYLIQHFRDKQLMHLVQMLESRSFVIGCVEV